MVGVLTQKIDNAFIVWVAEKRRKYLYSPTSEAPTDFALGDTVAFDVENGNDVNMRHGNGHTTPTEKEERVAL